MEAEAAEEEEGAEAVPEAGKAELGAAADVEAGGDEAEVEEEGEEEGEEEDDGCVAPGRACGILSYMRLSSSLPAAVSCSRMERRHSRSAL